MGFTTVYLPVTTRQIHVFIIKLKQINKNIKKREVFGKEFVVGLVVADC